MKRNALFAVPAAILALILSLSSCDDFYSSSWGNSREYDPDKIDVNADNWEEWNERAAGNPELAAALQKKLDKLLLSATGEEKAKLRTASVNAAIKQSGLGTLIITKGNQIFEDLNNLDLNNDEDVETLKGKAQDLMKELKGDFGEGSGGLDAANNIAATLGGAIVSTNNIPVYQGYSPEASEAGQTIIILAMASASETNNSIDLDDPNFDFEEYFDEIDEFSMDEETRQVKIEDTGTEPDPKLLSMAAMLNTINSSSDPKYDDNPITKGIKDAFLGKN